MTTITTVQCLYDSYQIRGELAKGGVGKIFATDRPDRVFKQYQGVDHAPARAHVEPLVEIGRQVILRDGIPVGKQPESSINWPMDLAPSPHGMVGVILPRLPVQVYDPTFGLPRGLEFLIMKRASPPAAKVRVALLLRMAEILAYLDVRKLVHGDISGKNLVWSAAPEPLMYLIDCDGLLPQGSAPAAGVQTPNWTDPRLVERQIRTHDHRSDWYALGLAMYRGLLLVPGSLKKTNGLWQAPANIPAQLDQRIVALLRRALDNPLNAAARPAPQEWVDTLVEVYLPTRTAFDEIALQILDRLAPSTPFVPLPPTSGPASSPPPYPYLTPAAPRAYAPPRPAPFYPPPPPPPPPPYGYGQPVPYPVPARPTPRPIDHQPGAMARWAMGMSASFHLVSLALSCMCLPASGVVLGITLYQLLRTPSYYNNRTAAIVAACIYLGFGLAMTCLAVVMGNLPDTTNV